MKCNTTFLTTQGHGDPETPAFLALAQSRAYIHWLFSDISYAPVFSLALQLDLGLSLIFFFAKSSCYKPLLLLIWHEKGSFRLELDGVKAVFWHHVNFSYVRWFFFPLKNKKKEKSVDHLSDPRQACMRFHIFVSAFLIIVIKDGIEENKTSFLGS